MFLIFAFVYGLSHGAKTSRTVSKNFSSKYFESSSFEFNIYSTSKYEQIYSRVFLGHKSKGKKPDYINDFYTSGTGHLLSISGLHIGSISLIIFLIVNSLFHIFLRDNKKYKIPYFYISIPLGFLFSFFYVFYIGFEVPRLRALILLGFLMMSFVFPVFRNKLLTLAITASLILIFMPSSVYSYSFYYSFASVLAILILPKRKNIYVCIIIFIFLIPLNLHSGGAVNPFHIIANFFIVPVFCFFYFPLMLFFNFKLLLGFTWVLSIMDSLTALLLKLLKFFSILGQYTSYERLQINTFEAVFLYLLILGFLVFFKYHKELSKRSVVAIYTISLSFALIFSVYIKVQYWDQPALTIFELAKPSRSRASGDIILINLDKKNILVDTGHGFFDTSSTIKKLKRLKIDSIDYLIITHKDLDHIGGLDKFKKAFLIKNIIVSPLEYKRVFYDAKNDLIQKDTVQKEDQNYLLACDGSFIKINKKFELQFINPNCKTSHGNPNKKALSFILRHPNINIVFSADVPFAILKDRVEEVSLSNKPFVLQMSHHCSNQDNPKKAFKSIKPLSAFCSRDKKLLSKGMLDENDFNFPIFATGKCGDIKIKLENRGFWIFSSKCSKKYLQFKKI
jgi:competence protein ComEC